MRTPDVTNNTVRSKNRMSTLKLQIGSGPFIRVSLPSKAPGDSDTFRGKSVVSCYSLQCSAEVEFPRSDLEQFAKHLQRVHETLNDEFHLESSDTRFRLAGMADNKGRVRIDVSVSGFQFSQPENSEWSASASFTCFPQEFEGAISELTKANKEQHPTD